MWLKGYLPFVAALAFAGTVVKGDGTTTTPAPTPEPAFTPYEIGQLIDLATGSYQKAGSGALCTGNTAAACIGGTDCIGLSTCSYCLCNPFTYGIQRSKLSRYITSAANSVWEHRGYYSSALSKCLKPMKIDDSCEENDQCPTWDQPTGSTITRKCESNKCVCKDNYHASSDRTSCEKPAYNQQCSSSIGCNSANFKCENNLCKCNDARGYYDNNGAKGDGYLKACRRRYYDEACDSTSPCDSSVGPHDSQVYLTCQNAKCRCNPDYYQTKTSTTPGTKGEANCEKIKVGSTSCKTAAFSSSTITPSPKREVCYSGHLNTQNTFCKDDTDGTCQCSHLYPIVDSGSMSCSKIPLDKPGCNSKANLEANQEKVQDYVAGNSNARCLGNNVMCKTDVDKCVCEENYPKQDGTNCRKYKINEAGCDMDSKCIAGTCVSGTCKCPANSPIASDDKMSCRQVKVGETGCKSTTSDSITFTNADNVHTACYDGGVTTKCNSGTCECEAGDTTHHTPNTGKTACGKSNYGQSCNENEDCNTGFKCSGTTCTCDDGENVRYFVDGSPATGASASTACKRIDLDSTTTCNSATQCEAYYVDNSDSRVECKSNICKCKTEYRKYGANKCDKEFEYDAACGSTAPNEVDCANNNLTCVNNKCACGTADNVWFSTKGQCLHEDAKYDVANGQSCTHSSADIADPADAGFRGSAAHTIWMTKVSSTTTASSSNSHVLKCGDSNAICSACSTNTNAVLPKTCQTYKTFSPPNDGARPAIALLTVVMMVALALKLA